MVVLFLLLLGVTTTYWAEAKGESETWPGWTSGAGPLQPGGNMEGKEVRFGIANSALFRHHDHGHQLAAR